MAFTSDEIRELTMIAFDQPPFWPEGINTHTNTQIRLTSTKKLAKPRGIEIFINSTNNSDVSLN